MVLHNCLHDRLGAVVMFQARPPSGSSVFFRFYLCTSRHQEYFLRVFIHFCMAQSGHAHASLFCFGLSNGEHPCLHVRMTDWRQLTASPSHLPTGTYFSLFSQMMPVVLILIGLIDFCVLSLSLRERERESFQGVLPTAAIVFFGQVTLSV
jgi:hypothetical protein